MTRMKPWELLAKVRALGIRRSDDLGEQHRDKLIKVFEDEILVFLGQESGRCGPRNS